MANEAGASASALPPMHRPSLPVHLTWKGVEIFFPTVVLGADLKEKADAAFRAKRWKESGKGPQKQSEVSSSGGIEGYDCILCGINVMTKSGLLKHMTIHNPAPATAGRKFGPCEKCGGVFSKHSRLSAHRLICKGKKLEGMPDLSGEAKNKANSPSKSDDSEEDYIVQVPVLKSKHIKREIPELQVKTCLDLETDDEDAEPNNETDSNKVNKEEESKERPSNCQICKMAFRENENVRSHENMCARMLEKFDSSGKERKYHCTSCPWKFLTLRSLQNHTITHLNKKPLKCSVISCSERFSRPDNLNKHMARAHSGHDGKLYSCGKCHARFDSTDLLIKHVEVCKTLPSNTYIDASVDLTNASTKHVPVTSGHSCTQCGKRFRRMLDLRNHARSHETTKTMLQNKLSKRLQKSKRAQLVKRNANHSNKNPDKNNSSPEKEVEAPAVSDAKSVENEDSKSSSSKGEGETIEFHCDACGAGFSDKISLSRHCLSHVLGGITEQIGNKPSTVAKVPSSFTQDSDSAPSSAKALYFECRFPNCTHGFSHDEDLWFHIEKKHKTPFNHCCDKCGLDCLSEVIYNDHKQSAHPHGQLIEMADVNPSIDDIDIKMEDYQGADDYSDDVDQESDYPRAPVDVLDRDIESPCKDIRIDYASICSRKAVIEISSDLKSRADAAAKSYEVINIEEDEVIDIEDDEEVVHVEGNQVINIEDDKTSHTSEPARNPTARGSNKDSDSDFVVEDHQESEDDSDPDFDPSSENIRKPRKKWDQSHSSFMSDETCYKCELCCKVFYEVSKFSAHMNNHEFARERGRVWSNSTTFRRQTNLREDVPIQDTYSCEQCKKTYDDRKSYICHLNYHDWMKRQGKGSNVGQRKRFRDDIPFQDVYNCEKCNETFSVRINFINHINYHKKMEEKGIEWTNKSSKSNRRTRCREDIPFQDVYTCSLCVHNGTAKTFEIRNDYVLHVNYHAKMKAKGIDWTWTPPKENKKGPRHPNFRDDIPVQDVYTCSICPLKAFKNRQEYVIHANYHDKMREKGVDWKWTPEGRRGSNYRDDIPVQDVYTCSICPLKAFDGRKEYIMHANYHDKMREKGIDWKWTPQDLRNRKGKDSPRFRDDIPFQDVYTCSICSTNDQTTRTFTDRMAFIAHLNYHKVRNSRSGGGRRGRFRSDIPVQDVYTCSLCDDRKEFTVRLSYIQHLYYHQLSRNWAMKGSKAKRRGRGRVSDIPFLDEYTCNVCRPERTFTSRNSYISHYQYHKLIAKSGYHRPIKQLRRNVKFHTVSKLRQKTEQNPSTPAFSSFQEEDIPIEDNYSCNICNDNTTFTDRNAYIAHLNSHASSEPEDTHQYEETSSDEVPRQRVSNAKVPIQRVYCCKCCPEIKTFTARAKYLSHLSYHRNKRKELDSITEIPSDEEEDSVDNISIARIPIQDTYRCKLCQEERVFTKRNSYSRHLRRHKLLKDKTFQCLLCEKAFSSAWNLSTHSKTHTGEKAHICGDCGKRFSANGVLQRHALKCLKIPCKYTCHCGEKFHAVASLKAHEEKFHADQDPQDIANSASNSKKSFHCYVCKQEFGTPSELDFHVQREHNQDYIEFMMQRAGNKANNVESTDKECDAERLSEDKESPIGSEHDDESNLEMLQPICEIQVKNETEEMHAQEDSNEITIPPPSSGWNFIPELENKDDDEEEGDQMVYEDFSPETFEPEEVEVGEGGMPSLYEEIQVEESPAFNYSEGHQENSPMSFSRAEKSVPKKSRTYKKDGCYKCGYCDKKSHRVPYIKVHCNRIHSGLPFKYDDLSSDEIAPKKRKRGSGPGPVATSTSSSFDTPPEPSSSRQQQTQSIIERVKQKIVASQATHSDSNSSSQNSKTRSILPKKSRIVRAPCSCSTVDDSPLGLLKRCTGSGCPCYFNYKGCGEGCSCSTVCSNPFFRRRDSNGDQNSSKKEVPGLLPVSMIPMSNLSTDMMTTSNTPSDHFPTNTLTFMVSTPTEGEACSDYQNPSPIIVNSPLLNSLLAPQPDNLFNDAEVTAFRVISPPGQRPESNQFQTVLTTASSMTCENRNGRGFGDMSTTANNASELRQSTGQRKPIVVSKEYFSQLIATLDVHESHLAFLKLLRCNYCLEDDFANLSAYLRHLWKHRTELTFYCPICVTSFPILTLLLLHARSHTKILELPVSDQFFCPVCSASFENEVTLNWHVQTLHLPVNCGICYQQFNNEAVLYQHEGRAHKDVNAVSCRIRTCQKPFLNKTALGMHLFRYHKKCEICSTFYQDTDALKEHIMSNHGGRGYPSINTTVCNITDNSFMGYPTIAITNTSFSTENNLDAPVLQSYYNSVSVPNDSSYFTG